MRKEKFMQPINLVLGINNLRIYNFKTKYEQIRVIKSNYFPEKIYKIK